MNRIYTKINSKAAMVLAFILIAVTLTTAAWTFKSATSRQAVALANGQKLFFNAQSEIPIQINDVVLYWLNKSLATEGARKDLRATIQRMKKYKPMILKQLRAANLPEQLLAVPLVESRFLRTAVSPKQAVGIWQFRPITARACGLIVNEVVDERQHPQRLTEAAVCHYQQLINRFNNWHVALTAYNIGGTKMAQLIRTQGHDDVFQMAKEGLLSKEGANYLPKLMAAFIILQNPQVLN